MIVELTPETEALIQRHLQSGAFRNAEEVIEHALESLNTEDGLTDDRDEISTRVQAGWDEAQQGLLTDGDDVRAQMQQFKEDWKSLRHPA